MLNAKQSLRDWYMLVMDYTTRQLTNARDRLPAISGVARIIAERLGWEYVAGLWSHDLEGALLWFVLEPETSLSINPAHYSGPSWSWASADRPTLYDLPPMSGKRHPRSWIQGRDKLLRLSGLDWASHYEVRNFSMELAGEDPFAEVKAGQVTILGNTRTTPRPVLPKPSWQPQAFAYRDSSTIDVVYWPDQTMLQVESEASGQANICCLLLAGFSRNDSLPVCYALVLQAVSGSTTTFRRIGMMAFARDEESGERWDEAVDWLLAAETREIYLV